MNWAVAIVLSIFYSPFAYYTDCVAFTARN